MKKTTTKPAKTSTASKKGVRPEEALIRAFLGIPDSWPLPIRYRHLGQ